MTIAHGLSLKEAHYRLGIYGLNEIHKKASGQAFTIFISQLHDWLIIILILATIVSIYLGEIIDSIVILSIVLLSVIFGFIQEYHAEKTLENLKKYITHKAKVFRDNHWIEIKSKYVVPGDLVKLRIGDRVPADLKLIEYENLSIDESILTGESLPSNKSDNINLAYSGTYVSSGTGMGIVEKTGQKSFLGEIAKKLEKPGAPSDFQKQIKKFSTLLFNVVLILTVFVFIANAALGKGYLNSFLFAVALAVGITPELLPMVITVTLSHGSLKLAKNKVITKKLISVEDLGNIDTLCSDKTGTLTEGKFKLSGAIPLPKTDKNHFFEHALIATSSFKEKGFLGKDELDHALWESQSAKDLKNSLNQYQYLDENEFDFKRRRISVLVKNQKQNLLISKGSVDSILSIIKNRPPGIKNKINKYETQGFRVILVASKILKQDKITLTDEKDLNLEGILLFTDPVKKDAASSLDLFEKLGVRIKIISGDSPNIVQKIAKELNFKEFAEKVITGDDIENLNEAQLEKIAEKYALFARINPEQKQKLVACLNKEGHIVGYLGDGVNDALALKAADVGISVDTGAEVAKEASDIVLLEKNLTVLGQGIEEGRKTFGNITKYILNTISANFGNMATVALSSLFLPFIPLLPGQILLNNFISDIPLLAISTDNVDASFVKKPKRWNIKLIGKSMLYFGIISSFFDFLTIIPLLFIWKLSPSAFRTAWFIESALSEIVVTFALRTKLRFYKSSPSPALLYLSIFAVFFVFMFPMTFWGNYLFDFKMLNFSVIIWIFIVLTIYFAVIESVKNWYFDLFE